MKHGAVSLLLFLIACSLSSLPTDGRPNLPRELIEQAEDDRTRVVNVDWTYMEDDKESVLIRDFVKKKKKQDNS